MNSIVFPHFPVYADWVATAGRPSDGHGSGSIGWAYKVNLKRQDSEREIERNAHVWLNEPYVHIGDVERVLVDEETEKVTGLVMRVGFGFGHLVVLPIDNVVDSNDVVIHVQLTAEELEALELFEEPLGS